MPEPTAMDRLRVAVAKGAPKKIWDDDYIDPDDGDEVKLSQVVVLPAPTEAEAVDALVLATESLVRLAGVWPEHRMRIWVPPYTRVNVRGNIEYVDGYWRSGDITTLNSDERRSIARAYEQVGEFGGDAAVPLPSFDFDRMGTIGGDPTHITNRDRPFVTERARRFVDRQVATPGMMTEVVTQVSNARLREEKIRRELIEANAERAKETLRDRVGLTAQGLPEMASFEEGPPYRVVSSIAGTELVGFETAQAAAASAARMASALQDVIGVYEVDARGKGTRLMVAEMQDPETPDETNPDEVPVEVPEPTETPEVEPTEDPDAPEDPAEA